jgi:hypothetical protein
MMMETKTIYLRSLAIKFECEDIEEDGGWLDTMVRIDGKYLMWIAGCDVDKFIEDFKRLDHYAI